MTREKHMEGTCVSRGLCESISLLAEQRLAFDTRMGERTRASEARPLLLLSPSRDRHGDQMSHREGAEATRSLSEPLNDIHLTNQSAGWLMSKEARVTYMKLRGDQLLHLAEMARHDGGSSSQCEGRAAEALEAYISAQEEASSKINGSETASNIVSSSSRSTLPELHPLRVELSLRISSVLLHFLDRPVEAWQVGYPTYLAAAEHPTRLGARGLAITQALRDHLARIDIKQDGEGREREGRGNSEETDVRHDSSSATHGQGTVGGTGEDGHGKSLVGGEWSFLRMSPECDEAREQGVGDGTTAVDKLRNLAQVKQARACMETATATDRVLLGTMEQADVVQSALKQIFFAYTKRYAKSAQNWVDGSKNLWVQRRKAMPQAHLWECQFLSWAGFEAVCQDFHIITTPTSSVADSASRHPRPQANHHPIHQPIRGASLDHKPQSKAGPGTSASKPTRQSDSPTKVFAAVEAPSSVLVSAVQACMAFVSACTHGSMVASFPNGGTSDGIVTDDHARRDGMSGGTPAGEKERMSGAEEDAGFWRGVERAVLSGSAALEASSAPGLSFGQFVDALARCGLLGFLGNNMDGTWTFGGGLGAGFGVTRNNLASTAEIVQAMFVTKMRLLDNQHVDARLQQLVRPPSTNHEGEASEEGNRLDGIKQRDARGQASGAGGGRGGKNKRGHTARGTNAGGPRGGTRKAVVDPKPATVLAPIETTPRARKQA